MPDGGNPEIAASIAPATPPEVVKENVLPSQQLPDKAHEPLVSPVEKILTGVHSEFGNPSLPSEIVNVKWHEPTDEEVAKQIEKMKSRVMHKDFQADLDDKQRPTDGIVQILTEPRIPQKAEIAATVENRRVSQNLGNFSDLYNSREAILATTNSNDLADLIARNPGSPEIVNLQNIENQMRQVFDSAVTASGFSIDRKRILDDEYLTELYSRINTLRGAGLTETQADSLKNYVENANLATLGQETDGLGWEYQVPDATERINQLIDKGDPITGSTFQQTVEVVKRLNQLDVNNPPRGIDQPTWQQTIDAARAQSAQERDQIIAAAEQAGILHYATDAMMSSFNLVQVQRFKAQQRAEEPTPEQLAFKILQDFREVFWDWNDPALKNPQGGSLRDDFEGVGEYLAPAVVNSVLKELHDPEQPLNPNDMGDRLLQELKDKRYKMRKRATSKERLVFNTYMQRYTFEWAETKEEMRDVVFDFIEKFEEVVASKPVTEAGGAINTWKHGGEAAFDERINSLGLSEAKDHEIKMLKATIEAFTEVIGGVKMLEAGKAGFEGYVGFLEQFGYDFNEHHDAMYLMNRKAAIAHSVLAENDGDIFRSGDEDLDKPLHGETLTYREKKEIRAKKFAAEHEIYVTDDDFRERHHDGYTFDDNIEELLLADQRGMIRALSINDPDKRAEAVVRTNARTAVFGRIKARLDKEDGLAGLTDDQRRDEIRGRIRSEIDALGYEKLGNEIDALPNQDAKDKALWEWVHHLNHERHERRMESWFPSQWDMVRLSIDKPQKLLDRALRKKAKVSDGRGNTVVINELRAMLEESEEIYTYNFNGQVGSIDYKGLTEHQIGHKVDHIPGLTDLQRRELKEDIKFEREQRIVEADRAVRNGRTYATFLGAEARWGGLVARVVDESGQVKMKTISGMARDILSAKIAAEEAEIEAKTQAAIQVLIQNNPGLTPEQIEEKTIEQRRLFRRHTTFAATHGLKEIGLVEGNLPVWNYYYYNDEEMIKAFAPLVGYTDSDKPELHQLLDRGRRELRAVYDYLAEQYMDGRVFMVRKDDQLVIEDPNGNQKTFDEEIYDRARNINKGGNLTLRRLFESRFMISTSGGVEVADLISKIGDLGIYDMLWEHASEDLQEFHGFIKRRDEAELRQQSYWNIDEWKDAVSYAQRLKAAPEGSAALTGGKVGGKSVPGILNEPMSGAYKYRDEFIKDSSWLDGSEEFIHHMDFRDPRNKWVANLQHRIDDLDSENKLLPEEKDRLVEIGAGIIGPLITLMDARNYVMNRAGRAPKNWKLDNELLFQQYAKELLKRSPLLDEAGTQIQKWGAETLGALGLDYAIQGRSLLAVAFYDAILRTSSYHLLNEKERRQFSSLGKKVEANLKQKKAQIAARPLPANIQTMIANREQDLLLKGASQSKIDEEKKRLTMQYQNEQLHKEFAGEWAASFSHIGDIKSFQSGAH